MAGLGAVAGVRGGGSLDRTHRPVPGFLGTQKREDNRQEAKAEREAQTERTARRVEAAVAMVESVHRRFLTYMDEEGTWADGIPMFMNGVGDDAQLLGAKMLVDDLDFSKWAREQAKAVRDVSASITDQEALATALKTDDLTDIVLSWATDPVGSKPWPTLF